MQLPASALRYVPYLFCLIGALISLGLSFVSLLWLLAAVPLSLLALMGTWDVLQKRRTISRNYPVVAHFRYLLESIGPELR
ncbi:MAG: FMN-binding glutamate synthase family protein, partial [Pseudomonas neustonica]